MGCSTNKSYKQVLRLEKQARHKGGLPDLLVAFNLEQGGPRACGRCQLVQPEGAKGLDLPPNVPGQLPSSPEVNVCIILKNLDLPYKSHSSSAHLTLQILHCLCRHTTATPGECPEFQSLSCVKPLCYPWNPLLFIGAQLLLKPLYTSCLCMPAYSTAAHLAGLKHNTSVKKSSMILRVQV